MQVKRRIKLYPHVTRSSFLNRYYNIVSCLTQQHFTHLNKRVILIFRTSGVVSPLYLFTYWLTYLHGLVSSRRTDVRSAFTKCPKHLVRAHQNFHSATFEPRPDFTHPRVPIRRRLFSSSQSHALDACLQTLNWITCRGAILTCVSQQDVLTQYYYPSSGAILCESAKQLH